MNKDLAVSLSDLPADEGAPGFMDVKYFTDQDVGNSAQTMLTLSDYGGAVINLYIKSKYDKDEIIEVKDVDSITIEFFGSCERDDFLRGLQMILSAEKILEILT